MRIAGLAQEPIPIKASTETATENGAKLWRAARFGQLPRVQRLLKLGANVGYRCNEHGTAALHQAAGDSHKDVMEALLESDANVDDMDHEGKTALHYATSVDIVKSLVMAGADVDHEGREGRTPGRVALVRKSTAVLNAFIEGLADPSKIFEPRLRTDSSRFETSGKLSEGEETDLQDYHALRAPDRQNRSLYNRILSVQDATQCASRTSPVMYQALQARETAINFRQLITPLPWTTVSRGID